MSFRVHLTNRIVGGETADERRVILNGRLYFIIAFLSPLASLLDTTGKYDYWPTLPRIAAAVLAGLVAGFTALRAYRDGGFARWQERQNGTVDPKP